MLHRCLMKGIFTVVSAQSQYVQICTKSLCTDVQKYNELLFPRIHTVRSAILELDVFVSAHLLISHMMLFLVIFAHTIFSSHAGTSAHDVASCYFAHIIVSSHAGTSVHIQGFYLPFYFDSLL